MDPKHLLNTLFEAAYIVDENRKILYWNDACEAITGYTKEDVVGHYCYDNILRHVTEDGIQLCHDGCPLQDTIIRNVINEATVYLHHKKGYRVPVSVKTIPFYDDNDGTSKAIEFFTDVPSKAKLYQEHRKLKESSSIDTLTQLYNRAFIDYQIETSINEANTFDIGLGILFIDIDHFKKVNDTYGHPAGDQVLQMISKTLALNVRSHDFVGRYGGEEFIVLLRDIDRPSLQMVAQKLRVLVQEATTFIDDSKPINVTISLGGAMLTKDLTKDAWIKHADDAMYQAKAQGRNRVVITK
jgi:diguanylate cyclase (GGDEF)-like protein/PAS domain S-box-containing protein